MTGIARLSLNQMTTRRWTLAQAVDGCARAGIGAIGIWREPLAATGVGAAADLIRDAGLRVSSLCRGGFLTAGDAGSRQQALDDNRRAIDEAAELGATCLVMVVGGLPAGSRDLPGARANVSDGIAALVPHARQAGIRLALEPLHPMYCADRPSWVRFRSTVVNGGRDVAAMTSQLSNPISAICAGTAMPSSRNVSETPRAIWSDPQKIASTSGLDRNRMCVACRPHSSLHSPCRTAEPASSSPASASASWAP